MSCQKALLLELINCLVAVNLSNSDNDLPCVAAGKHVEIDFNFKFMRSRSPGDVSNNLFPIKVTPMRRSIIIRQQNMRPKTLLTPQPRHLGPIPMPKLRIFIAFKTIRCSLKRRRNEQILSRYQILRMYLFNQYLRWDQGKPYLLENIFQFIDLFFIKLAIL